MQSDVNSKTIHVILSNKLHEALRQRAFDDRASMSELVRQALDEYMLKDGASQTDNVYNVKEGSRASRYLNIDKRPELMSSEESIKKESWQLVLSASSIDDIGRQHIHAIFDTVRYEQQQSIQSVLKENNDSKKLADYMTEEDLPDYLVQAMWNVIEELKKENTE